MQTLAGRALSMFGCAWLTMCASASQPSRPPAAPVASRHYVWKNVAIGGGGFVTGIVFNPTERDLVYLRTDVGGAYRRDARSRTWEPMLDWVGAPDWNLHGIESLATDPVEPGRVYLAAGTYTNPDVSNGEILRSSDYGRTWKRTPMPFKMGGNEAGRGSGERLAIDPHQNDILYFGSRRDGLWRSSDYGANFARVDSFPSVSDDSIHHQSDPGSGRFNYLAQAVGIVFVLFDPSTGRTGEPSPVIYAAVSTAKTSLFRSLDAGASWGAVPGQPTGFRPTHAALSPEGTLFITYADEPGPNRMQDGAVYRLDTKTGVFTNITPEKPTAPSHKFGYAAVGVDTSHPATVVVSTWNRGNPFDEIFRSTDGGRTWSPMMETAEWDHTVSPYTRTMHHHWMSDVEIDPFDAEYIVFTTGYGIWAAHNARQADQGKPVRWQFDDQGVEETVPLALISPPEGAHLLSGLGDIDGFRHDDLDVSPTRGKFDAPGFKNTEWLDFAAKAPSILVRTGTTYGNDRILGAFSTDGGTSWTGFLAQPPAADETRPFATGPISISADGAVIIWTTRGNSPYFTRDRGQSWQKVQNAPVDMRVAFDRIDAGRLYGYDASTGVLYGGQVDNGEVTMDPRLSGLPALKKGRRPPYANLAPVPERAGELWLAIDGELLRFTNFGQAVARTASASEVTAIGFGKAAEGGTYPAAFVAGKINGVYGIHRSDDGGTSYTRINDDAHQFASITRLTGDPRIFGRVYCATGGRGIVYGSLSP
jgi:photosystem II stability/assembly factor-like uncharacterized protein